MKKGLKSVILFLIFSLLFFPNPAVAALSSGGNADYVVGQADMQSNASPASRTAYNLYSPSFAYAYGTRLFLADYGNNRILIYNSIPTANNASANVVVGQTSMTWGNPGTTAYNLTNPRHVYTDGTKLFITDPPNNRVLIYNSIPTSNNASADVVVGQGTMTSTTINPAGANRLSGPSSAFTYGTKLFITDNADHRVLIYNSIPTSNNASADVVVGQPDMTTITAGTSEYKLTNPVPSWTDGTKLYIGDFNHRILIYNSIPTTFNATYPAANIVIGQTSMGASTAGTTAYKLDTPRSVYSNGTKIYVSDGGSHRVLIYNSIPTANNASADIVLGKGEMESGSINALNANVLYQPRVVYTDGTKLYTADYYNNRVLIYNSIPSANGASADVVVGQPNMSSNLATTTAYGLYYPTSVYTNGTKLYVSEQMNNRILVYNSIPTANNASADIVIGQASMTSSTGGTTAYLLTQPMGVSSDGTKLYIADYGNYRVLIYNSIPTSNNASADVVVGPNQMTADGLNTTAYGLYNPNSSYSDGTKLYVSDFSNNRVLIYNSIPTSNLASADVVVGQTSMTAATATTTAYGSYGSASVYTDGTKLYVAEYSNNRILIYNSIPTANNASADIVIGQTSMTAATATTTAYGLYGPNSIYSNGTKLCVADYLNKRVLIYNSIPTANNASADVVVGQPDMTSATAGTTAYGLNGPSIAYIDGTKLYVSDSSNYRVLIYNSIPTSNNASADVVVGQPDMTTATAGTTAYTLSANPSAVFSYGTKLYVTDNANHRVLIYNSIPTANNASANVVVGQTGMAAASIGTTAYGLYNPGSTYTDGTKLYVTDYTNNRILIYNSIPTANNASADIVIGPDPMSTGTGGTTAYLLGQPSYAYSDGTKLYVADTPNNRVLIYNSIPTTNFLPADVVVGQTSMTATVSTPVRDYSLNYVRSAYSDGTKLYVADGSGSRVLIYNSIPATNNASANVVVGKAVMTSGSVGTTAYEMAGPEFALPYGGKLYVADTSNNRILIYNSIPTANNASANVVVGKNNMTSDYINSLDANSLYAPYGAHHDGTNLYVADYSNNRVLIYTDAATTTGEEYSTDKRLRHGTWFQNGAKKPMKGVGGQ